MKPSLRTTGILLAIGGCVLLLWAAVPATASAQNKEPTKGDADSLPERAIKRFGTTKLRHGSGISSLAFSANGTFLAAGGGNDIVRIWDVETGVQRRAIKDTRVNAVAFSPRDSVLATGGAFKKIHLWDTSTGIERHVLEGTKHPIKSLAFSPDGTLLASGEQDGTVRLWKMDTNALLTTFPGHTDEVAALAFSPDGTQLASAGCDRTIRVWSTETHKPVGRIDAECSVAGLAFNPDGTILISAGDDHHIRRWVADSGKALDVINGHEDAIVSLAIVPAGTTFVTGGRDRTIRFWDLETRKPGRVVPCSLGDGDAVALSKNGKLLAYAGVNGTIHLVDTDKGKERLAGLGANGPIAALGVSRNDGRVLVALGEDGNVDLWDTITGQKMQTLKAGPAGNVSVARALAGHPEHVQVKKGENVHNGVALAVVASADGKSFAAIDAAGKVSAGSLSLKLADKATALAIAADGKLLAAAAGSKIELWELPSGDVLGNFQTKEGPPATQPPVACLAFSPDGTTFAAGCFDAVLRLYNVKSGKETGALEGHTSAILSLAYSADGRTIATAGFDGSTRLWEVCSGKQIDAFAGHVGPVQAVCFAGDGRSIYSGGADTSIVRWDVTAISKDNVLPTPTPSAADLGTAWKKLADEDAGLGHRALWEMIAGSKDSVPFIESKLYLINPKEIDRLFTDLDDDRFDVRDRASAKLAEIGIWMRGRLTDTVKDPPSDEVRLRVERLLDKLNNSEAISLEQERVRIRRVIMALEQAGSPAASAVLHKLAEGAPEKFLQHEAEIALRRLAK